MKLFSDRDYRVYVQPTASDRGLSMGSAFEISKLSGDIPKSSKHMFLGCYTQILKLKMHSIIQVLLSEENLISVSLLPPKYPKVMFLLGSRSIRVVLAHWEVVVF